MCGCFEDMVQGFVGLRKIMDSRLWRGRRNEDEADLKVPNNDMGRVEGARLPVLKVDRSELQTLATWRRGNHNRVELAKPVVPLTKASNAPRTYPQLL